MSLRFTAAHLLFTADDAAADFIIARHLFSREMNFRHLPRA